MSKLDLGQQQFDLAAGPPQLVPSPKGAASSSRRPPSGCIADPRTADQKSKAGPVSFGAARPSSLGMTTKISSGSALLAVKTAIIHGGGGAIGGAVALAFVREGARVFLAGGTRARLQETAEQAQAAGGEVEIAVVDALDAAAVDAHAESVVARTQRIDVVLNAVGLKHVQGKSFAQQTLDEFASPVNGYTRAHFIIAKAAARAMVRQGSGVIL